MSGRPPPSGRYSDDDSFSSPDRSRPVPRRTPLYRDPPPAHSGRRRRPRGRGYSLPREKSRHRGSSRHETTLRLCVFDQTNHSWRTAVLKFDPHRATDQDVWHDVRRIYRDELQKFWRRVLGFKKLKSIAPIEYTANGVPKKTNDKDLPESHSFMHCYHHPSHIVTNHDWVDWFVEFDQSCPGVTNGLEFKESLWAEKLALIAIVLTIAIIVVSAVWCARGGQLQTVFTVMSFVLSGVAAEVALVALYFQVTQSN